MKKIGSAPRGGRAFLETALSPAGGDRKMVWMTDLKKAGERAEYLWSEIHKKKSRSSGRSGQGPSLFLKLRGNK